MWSVDKQSRYAYLGRLSPWSVQRLLCIQNNHRWYSVEIVVSCTVSALSNRALAHTLYDLPFKAPSISSNAFFTGTNSSALFSAACLVALTIGWNRVCSSSPIASFISRFTVLHRRMVFIAFTYSSTRAVHFAGSFISRNDILLLLLHLQTDTTLGRSRMCIHITFLLLCFSSQT